jgi:DNA-binding transcriptional ArsR family regulator
METSPPPTSPQPLRPFDAVYVEAAARILGVLSHPTRLHLILLLAQGETHVSRLAELLEIPQSNVSHHLGLLRNLGLVADRRDGQFVRYRVNTTAWELVAHGFFEHLVEGSDELRLRGFTLRRSSDGGDATAPDDGDGEPAGTPAGSSEADVSGEVIRTELRDVLLAELRAEVLSQVRYELREQLQRELREALRTEIEEEVPDAVRDLLREKARKERKARKKEKKARPRKGRKPASKGDAGAEQAPT